MLKEDYRKKHIKDIAKDLNDILGIYDPYAEETNLQELEDHLKGGDIEGYIESLEEFKNGLESEGEQTGIINYIEVVISELRGL